MKKLLIHKEIKDIQRSFTDKLSALSLRNTPRYISAVVFSLLMHVVIFSGYIGLSHITKPEILEIQEITFVDLTKEPPVKAKPQKAKKVQSKKIKKSVPQHQNPERKKSVAKAKPVAPKPEPKIDSGMFVKRKDMIRKQAPINLSKKKSIKLAKTESADILKVSQAKGTKNDKRIVQASAINLNRNSGIKLASNSQPIRREAPANSPKPKLSLNKKKLNAGLIVSTDSEPILPKQNLQNSNMFAALKKSQTVISGPLKYRKILRKPMPKFPQWAKSNGVGATISLQFTVMENGRVRENIIVTRTSGSREWDNMVIESIRKWRFVALSGTSRLDQNGVITFQFIID